MKRQLLGILLSMAIFACTPASVTKTGTAPELVPDIAGVTVPRNIAPLNFGVTGAERVKVEITAGECRIRVSGSFADIPVRQWHRLLSQADELEFRVCARKDGKWFGYEPFRIKVCDDEMDPYVLYRRIDPGYELYARMGIYLRELGSFKEKVVFDNSEVSPGCMNCHSVARCNAESFQLHLRGNKGGTYLRGGGLPDRVVDMKNSRTLGTVYPYWHPSENYIAYSTNDIRQSFHNVPEKVLEVYDLASDIVIYDVRKDEITVLPQLADSTMLETFPAFSADGNTLYYCCARRADNFADVRYSLMAVDFNPADCTLCGEPRVIWQSPGKSVSFPRPSYDGRWLMFTVSDFGNFSIWHPEADLWMMDLRDGSARALEELNSADTESYHSWSSNSKWIVFSSRRIDGRFTRPYIAHIGEDGHFDKPFMLPFRSPDDEAFMLQSYNIPEFCSGPVSIEKDLIYNTERKPITVR